MIQLRPYQKKAIAELRQKIKEGKRRLILCAPTGAGKTFIFSCMTKSAHDRGNSVLIVTDRIELMKQSGGSLNRLGVTPYEIKAGHEPATLNGQIYTAMVETLARRMKDARYQRLLSSFDVIVFDEAHKQAFNKLMKYIKLNTVVIGATATPYRKGRQKSLDEFYEDIVEVISIGELIDQGFLAKPLSYGASVDLSNVKMKGGDFDERSMGEEYSRNRVYAGVVENYKTICPGKKALSFCSNIESSVELTERMVDARINARHLDSRMNKYERVKTLAWFRRTSDAVLNNVGILTTGFDAPEIEVIILYRATTSLPLFLQMVGRGSRVAPGKTEFHILDFGENIHRHGFWEQDRVWSLKKAKKKRKQEAAPVKSCPSCQALLHTAVRVCKYCGHEFEFTNKEQMVAKLQLLTPRQRRQVAKESSLEEKAVMAKNRLIKPYWVLHTLDNYDDAKKFGELMGWKWGGWWYHNKHRFPNLQKGKKQKA